MSMIKSRIFENRNSQLFTLIAKSNLRLTPLIRRENAKLCFIIDQGLVISWGRVTLVNWFGLINRYQTRSNP